MRGGMKVLVQLVVAAGILVGLCSYGYGEEHSASAEAILRKTAKAYETLRTYQDETTLVVHVTVQGTQQRTETRYSLAVERPNKLALVFKSGNNGITLVSDGKGLYTYLAMLGQYTVEKAPGSLEELLKGGIPVGKVVRVLPFFGHDPYGTLMSDVEEVELVGDEVLGATKTYHVLLHQAESDIDLWIDAQSYLLKKIRVDMAKAIEKQRELMPEAAQMKMIIEEIHRQVKVGEAISPDIFVFDPPEGARLTDIFNVEQESSSVGKKAPDFTLEGLKKGTSFHLADYVGKVVMIGFWASWCPPCRQEMPILQEVYDRYKEKGLVFIAVNVGEDKSTAQRFVAGGGYTFPVALDPKGKVEKLYDVPGLPTLILIDRQGRVQKVHAGLLPDLKRRLERELETLLSGESVAGN